MLNKRKGVLHIKPLVSIIIPAYNAEETIQRTIDSCVNQSYEDIEIIIVDNCSTDETATIIKNNQDHRINYIYSNLRGRSLARNIGLEAAKGNYVQFLDADDELAGDKIEIGTLYLERNSDYKAHVSGVRYIKNYVEIKKVFPKLNYTEELLAHNIFPIHSVLFRNDKKIKFDDKLDYCEDWLFWVEELYGEKIYFETDYVGGITHIHESNTMKQKDLMNEYQLYVQQRIKRQYPIKKLPLFINEVKLLIIHYFTAEKERLTNESVQKNSRWLYLFLSGVLSLPAVRQIVQKKVENVLKENFY